MEYVLDAEEESEDILQIGCIAPDCDDLGPTGHCSPDC